MPFDFDPNEIALKTGIASDRIRNNVNTYVAMSKVFPALEAAGQDVGLYGGTALNKVYFGKRQRLSYDLDIFCRDRKAAAAALEKGGARHVKSDVAGGRGELLRMEFEGVQLDIWEVKKWIERPAKREASDLLYYLGYLVPPVMVPTYSLEYLLAEKAVAMMDRNELKDIYDLWLGLQILKHRENFRKCLRTVARRRGIKDLKGYYAYQAATMRDGVDYYRRKAIDVVYQPPAEAMLKDVESRLPALL